MQNIGDLFKQLVFDKIVKMLIQKLFIAAPFLAWGPLAKIITTILVKLADKLYAALELYIDFQVIAFKNKGLESVFTKASVDLYSIANQHGIESPEFVEARRVNDEAFYKFVEMGFSKPA